MVPGTLEHPRNLSSQVPQGTAATATLRRYATALPSSTAFCVHSVFITTLCYSTLLCCRSGQLKRLHTMGSPREFRAREAQMRVVTSEDATSGEL